MSESLHPSGFIESAGSCAGPRYIRSQPSRESGGVLLNECEAKYVPAFELPYRNITRYIKEIQESWDKINPKDKQQIYDNLVINLPQLKQQINNSNKTETFTSNVNDFIKNYVSLNPYENTLEILDALYNHDDIMKAEYNDSTLENMQKAVKDWVEMNFHPGVLMFLFLLLVITCIILVVFYQNKNK